MNDPDYTIRNLIRMQLGHLPAAQAGLLQALCDENPAVQKHRDKVRRGLHYLETRPPVDYSFPIDSQDLAEWLENPATEGAIRIDEAAKKSDALLINLLELFRFHHLDCQGKPTTEHLHTRLLDLFDTNVPAAAEMNAADSHVNREFVAANDKGEPRISGVSVLTDEVLLAGKQKGGLPLVSSSPVLRTPQEFVFSDPIEVDLTREGERGELQWTHFLVPLAAGILLLFGGWAWFSNSNRDSQLSQAAHVESAVGERKLEKDSGKQSEVDAKVVDQRIGDDQKSSVGAMSQNPEKENDTGDRNAKTSDDTPNIAVIDKPPRLDSENRSLPEIPESSRATSSAEDRFTPALVWQSIKGVIAVGDPDGDELSGVQAPRNTSPNDRFVTLPGSWGEALLENQSTLILDEDTSITLNRVKAKANMIDVVLFNGRIALKNLPANTDLRVTAGEAQWFIETLKDSTVGVDYSGVTPVFFQRSGENLVNGRRINGREQSTWQNESYEFTSLTLPLTWISGPRGRVFDQDNAKLLTAKNLSRELDAFASRKNLDPQTATFLLQARLSAVPGRAYELMQSQLPGQSELVFEWLLSQLDTARRPLIVRMLAEKTGDRQQVQNVLHSFRQLRNPQSIGVELVDDACRHLTSQEVFFRVAAKQFLMKLSNNSNPVSYEVHDPPQTREEKARRWNSALKGRGNSPRRR